MGIIGRLLKKNDITLQYRVHGYKLRLRQAITLLDCIIKKY
jgi:hypothetical protein